MRYWSQEYIDNTHRTSYLGEHRKPYEEPVLSLEIVFCRNCWKHHTNWCPMYKEERNDFEEHIYVISDTADNGYCCAGEEKEKFNMEYISNEFVPDDWIIMAEENNATINIRFCRDCPFFEIDGVQPYEDVTRGWCRRLSFEGEGKYTPHYIRVDTNSFCNDDHASRGDDIEIL